ncbi:MAG TPA: PH domain-containing protein [Nocardioidaceae bacterium]|nr:PH domain-containing protein [Nocardioidaceae bacterium]
MTEPRESESHERHYRRLSPLTPLARSFVFLAAVVISSWDDLLRGELGPLAWLLLALLVAGAVYGTASWLRTKYWIEADELRVDTGVLSRQSRRIRIDRLQGVDIVQPFVARLLGLAELRMDVAGGSAREGTLAFLSLADAQALKDLLLTRRDQARNLRPVEPSPRPVESSPRPVEPVEGTRPEPVEGTPDRLIARVDPGQLVASVLLSPESLWLLVIAVGFAVGFLVSGVWVGFSGMVPVIGGIAVVQLRKLVGTWNFTVSEGPAGVQVRRGMFDLTSQTIALARLQGVVVSEPLLWRMLGWARADVAIAGYGSGDGDNGPSASTVLPVGSRPAVLDLVRHLLGGIDPDDVALVPAPRAARWAAPVGWRFLAAGADAAVLVGREGWFTRRTHVVPHARVQSLRLEQGPWQRRLGLADLRVDSPPGPVAVAARHRPAAQVRAMLETERQVSRRARRAAPGGRSPGTGQVGHPTAWSSPPPTGPPSRTTPPRAAGAPQTSGSGTTTPGAAPSALPSTRSRPASGSAGGRAGAPPHEGPAGPGPDR